MTIQFTVQGKPQAKERPRFKKTGDKTICYTPKKTKTYENLVRREYKKQCDSYYFRDLTPIVVSMRIYYPIPTKTKVTVRNDMLDGTIRPTTTPDIDNVIKIICDSLNGLAYKDDAQIVCVTATKYFSEIPRVEILLIGREYEDYDEN